MRFHMYLNVDQEIRDVFLNLAPNHCSKHSPTIQCLWLTDDRSETEE